MQRRIDAEAQRRSGAEAQRTTAGDGETALSALTSIDAGHVDKAPEGQPKKAKLSHQFVGRFDDDILHQAWICPPCTTSQITRHVGRNVRT